MTPSRRQNSRDPTGPLNGYPNGGNYIYIETSGPMLEGDYAKWAKIYYEDIVCINNLHVCICREK